MSGEERLKNALWRLNVKATCPAAPTELDLGSDDLQIDSSEDSTYSDGIISRLWFRISSCSGAMRCSCKKRDSKRSRHEFE